MCGACVVCRSSFQCLCDEWLVVWFDVVFCELVGGALVVGRDSLLCVVNNCVESIYKSQKTRT